jgi:enoyl-CoA hydratase
MEFETIVYHKKNNILLILLNRPDRLNAINNKLSEELEGAIDEAAKDSEVKVIIFSGKGESFCAGGDIKDMNFNSLEEVEIFFKKVQALFNKIENIEKPTIAAINGYALGGGCELALLCDIRIASERSTIGVPEIKMGFLPGGGGTQRLPRLIGTSYALEMLFTGESLNAEAAYRIGLVNKLVGHEMLIDEAMKFAEVLANKSSPALKMAKKLVYGGINMDLRSALEFEIQCVSHLSFNAMKNVAKKIR